MKLAPVAQRDHSDLVDLVTPDHGLIYVTLATVMANRLPGDAVWTLLVGPSSSGKSEMTNALDRLPEYHQVSTFTEAGLVSGSSDGTPGLLTEIDDYGLMVFKDLTTILSKHSSDRDGVLGCLREVYDGSYTRRLGNRGGSVKWEGKVGMIAAVTEMIDDYDLGQLGERFVRYRLPEPSDSDVGMISHLVWENLHDQAEIRARRSGVVAEFLAGLTIPDPLPDPTEDEKSRLSDLAELGAVCRSPVVRPRFKGDVIQRVPAAEGVGRILGQLGQLLVALRVIEVPGREVWPLLAQIALDGMHPLRRRVLDLAVAHEGQMTTVIFAARLDLPHTSLRRHLEDLRARGVLWRVAYTGPEAWEASDWTRAHWDAITSEYPTAATP
jgi:hypothetical protein